MKNKISFDVPFPTNLDDQILKTLLEGLLCRDVTFLFYSKASAKIWREGRGSNQRITLFLRRLLGLITWEKNHDRVQNKLQKSKRSLELR